MASSVHSVSCPFDISHVSLFISNFESIKALMKKPKTAFFGPSRRRALTGADFFREYATHRMMVRDKSGEEGLIAYAEFANYPNISALPVDCWMDWINHHFCAHSINVVNTLFLNLFIYTPAHNPSLLLSILNELFFRENKVRYVVVVEMPYKEYSNKLDRPNYDCLESFSKVIYPKEFSVKNCSNVQKLHIIYRDTAIAKMRYRRALPEDNDDMVEVIDIDRPDLRERLGDYYVAEELLREDDNHNVFIVTEVNHLSIGFIWLNDNVDVLKLVRNFEVAIYDNLVKFDPNKHSIEQILNVTELERKPSYKLFTTNAIDDLFDEFSIGAVMDDHRASKYSLGSRRKLDVKSEEGIIVVNDSWERYYSEEKSLRKFQVINDKVKHLDYYTLTYDKRCHFRLNAPEHTTMDDAEPYIDECSNVFAMQLFGIHAHHDARRISRFLATAFSAFPDRDYCVISLPPTTKMTRCLYEILKYFISAVPRPNASIHDRLFITHRSAILGEITVHKAREEDAHEIYHILKHDMRVFNRRTSRHSSACAAKGVPTPSDTQHHHATFDASGEVFIEGDIVRMILADVIENPFSSYQFVTIRCGSASQPVDQTAVVGYAILRKFSNLHLLKSNFLIPKIDEFNKFFRAEIIMLKLHPLYHFQSDIIFREIARVTGYWDFYYFAPNKSRHKPLTNDLSPHMQPIEPLRVKRVYTELPATKRRSDSGPPIKRINYSTDNFSVFNFNLRPSHFFGNSNNITVIGFTNMTKAFLRTLVFNWNTLETKNSYCCVPRLDVIIVAKPGVIEAEYESDLVCDQCKDQRDCWLNFQNHNSFIRDTVKRMDLRVWAKFISGFVKEINREKKYLRLDNGCDIFYNNLIICSAIDFGIPKDISSAHELPPNYAHINNRLDKILLFHKLRILRANSSENSPITIIVYGAHLRTFEFVNFLLLHDFKPTEIKLVIQFDSKERDMHMRFNIPYADLNIEHILHEMIEDLGIPMFWRMNFVEWRQYHGDENISHVVFESFPDGRRMELPCTFFVSFDETNVDVHFLELLRSSEICLENNYILVDENYRTNDANIYALGRFTKHTVKPNHQHLYISPMEMADKLMRIFDLSLSRGETSEKFSQPNYFQAQLPLGHYIVKVNQPKRYLANHLTNDYNVPLVTYYEGNFCRVRLNEHGFVEEIVCVTQTRMSLDFLQHFVGKHESMLNDLHSRWYLREIRSFILFFQEPWTELIMHPKFYELHEELTSLCLEVGMDIMGVHGNMERKTRRELMKRYMHDLGTTRDMETAVILFLRKYRSDFKKQFALPEDFPNTVQIEQAMA